MCHKKVIDKYRDSSLYAIIRPLIYKILRNSYISKKNKMYDKQFKFIIP